MNRLQSIAARQDNERERLANLGMTAIRPLTIKVRAAVIQAYKWGGHTPHHIAEMVRQLTPVVQDAMVAAHMQGRYRSLVQARPALEQASAFDAYATAVDFLQRKMDLSDADLGALADLYGPAAAKVTGDIGGELQRKVSEAVLEAAKEGVHVQGGIQLIRQAFDAAGVSPKNDYALESIFRTQVQVAYSAGQWNAHQEPAIDEVLWGYQYSTAGDDRVRPNHAALDGVRMTKDDPRWDKYTPPCGWACRCTTVPIWIGDAEAQVVEPPTGTVRVGNHDIPVGPDPGWGFHPGKLYRDTLSIGRAA